MKVKEYGYEVKVQCALCKEEHTLLVNRDDWDLFNSPNRPYIQDIFPYLSSAERELLISGMCDSCFTNLFGGDDDE